MNKFDKTLGTDFLVKLSVKQQNDQIYSWVSFPSNLLPNKCLKTREGKTGKAKLVKIHMPKKENMKN